MDITPITARLRVIANCVNSLREFQTMTRDEFLQSAVTTAAAERQSQVAIQAALDIGNIILSEIGADVPREYREVFPKLAEVDVLPHELAEKLVNMAKFRNVLVHLYMLVDHDRLYTYIQQDLGDFDQFAQHIAQYLSQLEEE